MAEVSLENLLTEKWNRALTFKAFVDFSQKNVDQMRENYEKTEIDQALSSDVKGFNKEVRLLAIGADWCGDHVANVPPMAKLCDLNPKIQLRVIDRDRNDDLMEHFLTNGAKAIPKIIIAAPHMRSYDTWGPRPAACQKIMSDNKDKMPKEQIYPMLREWYRNDKNQTTLREIWEKIQAQGQVV